MLLCELAQLYNEAVDVDKLVSASTWQHLEKAHPMLAKDIKRYLTSGNFSQAIDFINDVFTANHNGKTSASFPQLTKPEWMGLLEIVKYIKDNERVSRPVVNSSNSRYNTDTMATSDRLRESVALYDKILVFIQE